MTRRVRATLLADGPTDRCLVYLVDWAVGAVSGEGDIDFTLGFAEGIASGPLMERIPSVLSLFPADLLFVHRDSETADHEARLAEISSAAVRTASGTRVVPVVPVRMTEAWLLWNEEAIRLAADNPRGRTPLEVPRPSRVELVSDPKKALNEMLRAASGKSGRRLKRFNMDIARRRQRVAELIPDFAPLTDCPAFGRFLRSTREALATLP